MSNLVEHAKRELEHVGEDEDFKQKIINMVQIFSEMGHSGASAVFAIAMLTQLLEFKNLTPLTDDSEEWVFHGAETWGAPDGVWQNKRNGEAFSNDGGKTYYLLSEGAHNLNRAPIHTSVPTAQGSTNA